MMFDRCLAILRRPRQSTACICNGQSSIFSMSEDANLIVWSTNFVSVGLNHTRFVLTEAVKRRILPDGLRGCA